MHCLKRNSIALAFALLACVSLSAQELRTAYFMKGYSYRYLMNPAFSAERPFFSFPALGNLSMRGNGNVGLSDFLYTYDDPYQKTSLTTFMNKTVDSREFLSNLRDHNKLEGRIDMSIMTVGFRAWGGFNTIGIGLHSRNHINAPYELFDFMKTAELGGNGPKEYVIRNFQMNSQSYVDFIIGHSHPVNDRLSVGANLKFLIGAANIETRFNQMRIAMGEEEWLIHANGYLDASAKGVYFSTKEEGEMSKVKIDEPGIGGYGAAIDLGITYAMLDNLTISASVADLGFIHWMHGMRGATSNDAYSFKGFEMIGIGSGSDYDTVEDQFDKIGGDLKAMARLYDRGQMKKTTVLGATVRTGLEFELPSYRNLSFGLLSSTYINHPYTWTEGRLSVNIAPLSWFEAALSGVVSNMGAGFGFMLNFHPKGFGLFVGTDFMLTSLTPQYIPVHKMNAGFSMGINFPLGSRHSKW